MSWLILKLLSQAIDDLPTAGALACTCSYAPRVPVRLVHARLMAELRALDRELAMDMIMHFQGFNPFEVDRSRITRWVRVSGDVDPEAFVIRPPGKFLLRATETRSGMSEASWPLSSHFA